MANDNKSHSEILTIMLVDIAGYVKTTSRLRRESIDDLHDIFDSITLPIFEKYNGNVIKKIGDSFLATFKSATNALLCGMELQNAFFRYNQQFRPKYPLKIRVIVHTGEVVHRQGDIFGEAVNVAARVESITKPGYIMFTDSVFLSMNKNEIPHVHIGLKKLRGVKYPVRLFRVRREKSLLRRQLVS